MLNSLRAAAKSPAALLLIGLLVLSFAVWGVQDIFTGASGTSAARVGETRVTERAVRQAFDREVERIARQSSGVFNAEQARMFGLDRQVVNTLVSQAVLDEKARRLNLGVTDTDVLNVAREIPAFRDPLTGVFDPAVYLERLRANGLRPSEFEADIRKSLARDQFVGSVGAGLAAPASLGAARLAYFGEERRVSVVEIPADAAPEPPAASEAELEALLAANAADFTAPEYRELSYFALDAIDIMPDVVISQDDLQAEFAVRSASLTTPERRDLVELTVGAEEVAQDVATRLRAGEDAATVAAELGLPAAVESVGARREDLFDPQVADAAFALAEPGVTAPFQTAFGWKVVQVGAITPGQSPAFEEAVGDIELALRRELAIDQLFGVVDTFESARDAGATLEEAAQQVNAAAFRVLPVDARGFDMEGARVDPLADRPALLATAFEAARGVESPLEELGEEGFFAVRVEEITPSRPRTLDEVRGELEARWLAQKLSAGLDELAADARAQLEAGAPPAVAAAPTGELFQIVELARRDIADHPFAAVLSRAFVAAPGSVVVAQAEDGGRLVARVEEIAGAMTPSDAEARSIGDLIVDELAGDLADLTMASLRREFDVSINQVVVDRATGASTQP